MNSGTQSRTLPRYQKEMKEMKLLIIHLISSSVNRNKTIVLLEN